MQQAGPLNLTATPSMGQDGQISWSLCTSGSVCGGQGNYPAIELSKGSPATPITITINDANNLGIKFAAGQDAMWLQPGHNNCPQSYVWDSGNPAQIPSFHRVSDTKIKFTDNNSNSGGDLHLTYRLNFVDAKNNPVTAIDPDIKNGGTNLYSGVTAAYVIGAAVIASLVAIAVSAFIARAIARAEVRRAR